MKVSITEVIPNPLQAPTCKQPLQVRFHFEALCDYDRISAEVTKDFWFPKFNKSTTSRLEREVGESDEYFNQVIDLFID